MVIGPAAVDKQRRVFGWIKADHPQRAPEVGETLFG
jgi:hypothetical protein